ncbi:MAG: DUF4412 domain-containing protein [Flavobacteriaceae bacterium]|nr:DUF4412 domain-containing protein [Flavobacteriaceae bacterium]
MRITLLIIYFSIISFLSFAQPNNNTQNNLNSIENSSNSFEGSIKFVQKTLNDTNYYTYHIQGNRVKLDVHENCNNCTGLETSMIFDLEKKTIKALNPSRKMYINVPPKPYIEPSSKSFKIIKSNNNKKIMGYKCYQWRVKNVEDNTEISYWVAEDNFMFYEELLHLWNRSEKHAVYFLQIPDIDGYLYMLSVERTTLRDKKMSLEVVEIVKKPIDKSIFEIPANYQSYDH